MLRGTTPNWKTDARFSITINILSKRSGRAHRALRVDEQQMFGEAVVHARQHVGTRVGRAFAHQEVSVIAQEFLGIVATHLSVVPALLLELGERAQGRARQHRAAVIHRRRLIQHGRRRRRGLSHDRLFERLCVETRATVSTYVMVNLGVTCFISFDKSIYLFIYFSSQPKNANISFSILKFQDISEKICCQLIIKVL